MSRSSMVERVARACAAARFGTTVDRLYWEQESDSWRQAHIDIALAAIRAMREPCDAMVAAIPASPYDPLSYKHAYQTMIDKVLADYAS